MALNISDLALIVATLSGPLMAVQAQRVVDRRRQSQDRRVQIFRILMATRANRVSPEHVQALNLIDVEFFEPRRRVRKQRSSLSKVRSAWHSYRDHLFTTAPTDKSQDAVYAGNRNALFNELLLVMSQATGYDFDESELKKLAYMPQLHEDNDLEHAAIRRGLASVLTGKAGLPVEVVTRDATGPDQKREPRRYRLI